MRGDLDLMKTPLFIIKKLQRDALRSQLTFPAGRVLDIGAGTQAYRRYIACSDYVSIDVSRAGRPRACGSAASLPFASDAFDTVLCTEVLEHVAEPLAVVREAGRVLKRGGRLYVTAPQSWGLHYEPYDYWRFTKYGLERLLAGAGFRTVGCVRIGGVGSLLGQEGIDALAVVVQASFSWLGPRQAERLAACVTLPLSLFFYALSRAADRIDRRYALGWAVLAVK